MCNDYEQHIRWAHYCATMQAAELGILSQQSQVDLPQTDDIRINDLGPVMRACFFAFGIAATITAHQDRLNSNRFSIERVDPGAS